MANEDTKNLQDEGITGQAAAGQVDDDDWGDEPVAAPAQPIAIPSGEASGGFEDLTTNDLSTQAPTNDPAAGADEESRGGGDDWSDPEGDDDQNGKEDAWEEASEETFDDDEREEQQKPKASKAKVYGIMGASLAALLGIIGGTLYWTTTPRTVHRPKPVAMASVRTAAPLEDVQKPIQTPAESVVHTQKAAPKGAEPAQKAMTLEDIDAHIAQAAAKKEADAKAAAAKNGPPPDGPVQKLAQGDHAVVAQPNQGVVTGMDTPVAPVPVSPGASPDGSKLVEGHPTKALVVAQGGVQPPGSAAQISVSGAAASSSVPLALPADAAEILATSKVREAEAAKRLDVLSQTAVKQQEKIADLTTRVSALEDSLGKLEEARKTAQAAKDEAEKQVAQAATDAARADQQKKALAESGSSQAKLEAHRKRNHEKRLRDDAQAAADAAARKEKAKAEADERNARREEAKAEANAKREQARADAAAREEARKAARKVARASGSKITPPAMPAAAKSVRPVGVSSFKVVATYPVTQQPGMLPEKAWVTDGERLVQVTVGSTVAGAQVTRIEGTTVFTTGGTITAQRP